MTDEIMNYEEISREGLIDMLEEATERMTVAEVKLADLLDEEAQEQIIYRQIMDEKCPSDEVHCTCVPTLRLRIRELETALAGQQETVCAYCRQVFKREDHEAIREHILTCEKRPEKIIIEAGREVEKEYQRRLALLFDAAMKVVDQYQEDGEFEAVKALADLLKKGPGKDEAKAQETG